MPIKNRACFLLFFLFLIVYPRISFGQEIKTTLGKVDSLDISKSGNIIYDINGEICSLVILNTDLKGIKFYTNLGVEKVENRNNEYRVWIPNQASVLKFAIPGCPLYEYSLPHSGFKYSVIIIVVEAIINQKVVIQDTTKPNLSIITTPVKTKVKLNGLYQGRSPQIFIDPSFSTFSYVVKRKGYKKVASNDTMDVKSKMITVEMVSLTKSKRFFALYNYKQDQSFKSPKFIDNRHWMPGITFGVFGKTGYYGSFSYLYVWDDLGAESNLGYLGYYYKYNESKKISITSGINQQLGKSIFFYGGPGYTYRTYSQLGGEGMKSGSFNFSTGMILRIGWYYLLQIDYSKSIFGSFSSFGLGFGLNIAKKNKV